MEHPLHLHHGAMRRPDWVAGAVAGLVGGAVLMVLELLWTAATNDAGPWRSSQLVAALVLGPEVTHGSGHVFALKIVAVALATHYALGVLFGIVLGAVATWLNLERDLWRMAAIGAAFGALLYLLDFHGMALRFPWIVEMRGAATLFAHIVFGTTAALLYRRFARTPEPPA